jgi:S1-C subfamily serine protease
MVGVNTLKLKGSQELSYAITGTTAKRIAQESMATGQQPPH